MFTDQNVAFIGGGIMGEAMIRGLITRDIVAPEQIIVADPWGQRREELQDRYGINVTEDNREAAENGQIIVLSIKPQTLPYVLPEIRGHLRRQDLLLSILAGVPIKKLADGTAHAAVVRSMPNTPAQIGQGITVWTSTPEVTEVQKQQAQAILASLGREIYVEEEDYLDMATALSGSGPGYVFMMMEALIDAGVHLGFFPAHCRAARVPDDAWLGGVRHAVGQTRGRTAQPGDLARRHHGRGAVPHGKRAACARSSRAASGPPISVPSPWARARRRMTRKADRDRRLEIGD
jgi:pyrroline-5-carboxylate reductase